MPASIIRIVTRELARAFVTGKSTFFALGVSFEIESVRAHEYRVTSGNRDVGLRFMAENGKLRYFMA